MFARLPPYLLIFSRLVIGLTFALSAVGKFRRPFAFEQAVMNFSLLPQWAARPTAILFMLGEIGVVAAMGHGGFWLPRGFLLAAVLLVLFSVALAAGLARGLQTPCNCFGSTENPISPHDLLRNAGLFGFALLGWLAFPLAQGTVDGLEVILLGMMAAVFVILWIHIGDLVRLFQE